MNGEAQPVLPSNDTSGVAPGAGSPSTLMGVALLGWMERDEAVRFLIEDCHHKTALTTAAAEALWAESRERTTSLPERPATAGQLPLTDPEHEHAARFLHFLAAIGVPGVKVVKVDPMQLVVAQYCVAAEHAATYEALTATDADWWDLALPTKATNPDLQMNFRRNNFETGIDIELPHAEFIFGVHPHGGFGPRELLPYVSVMNVSDRLVVGKGYHRLYERVAVTQGALPHRLSLVALDPGTLYPAGAEAAAKAPDLSIFGKRPAVLADFFTEGLAMPVQLRRKKYRLEVRARLVADHVTGAELV